MKKYILTEEQAKSVMPLFNKLFKTYKKTLKEGAVFAQLVMLNSGEIETRCYLLNEQQCRRVRDITFEE